MFYLILPRFVVHKDLLSFSGGTHRHCKLRSNFAIAHGPTHVVNFHTWIIDCDAHTPIHLDICLAYVCSLKIGFLLKKFWLCWSFLFHEHYVLLEGYFLSSHRSLVFSCWLEYLLWSYQMKCFKKYVLTECGYWYSDFSEWV